MHQKRKGQFREIILILALPFLLNCFFLPGEIAAQKYVVKYEAPHESNTILEKSLKNNSRYDSIYIRQTVTKLSKLLPEEGYIYHHPDSVSFAKDTCFISWYIGPKFTFVFELTDEDKKWVESAGLSNMRTSNIFTDTTSQQFYTKKLIAYLTNHGFPFAKAQLVNTLGDSLKYIIKLDLENGPFVVFNEVLFSDSVKISDSYLYQTLGIKKEMPYNAQLVQDIAQKIKNLSFLTLQSPPKLSFLADRATVFLPLQNRKASKFDFIIGVLPNTVGQKRTFTINGEFLGDFTNRFGRGERLTLTFKRLSLEDQFLKSTVSVPFLLSSPFGVDGDFEIKRNRNISLDVLANFGARYTINTTNQIRAFWTHKSSNLINPDLDQILNQGRLPSNLDVRFRGGGFEYAYNKLDYIFNPRKGWYSRFNGTIGLRSIVQNQEILQLKNEKVDFSNAYDTIKSSNIQFNMEAELDHYLPISDLGTLRNKIAFASRYNDGKIIQNELYRIGGNRLLRGFNELSFLSDLYFVYTAEFRLILDQNSYLNLPFIDLAMFRNRNIVTESNFVQAYGIGIGMNFSTKAGIFNLSFAAGNYNKTGFDFANTKLHFGYLNLF